MVRSSRFDQGKTALPCLLISELVTVVPVSDILLVAIEASLMRVGDIFIILLVIAKSTEAIIGNRPRVQTLNAISVKVS